MAIYQVLGLWEQILGKLSVFRRKDLRVMMMIMICAWCKMYLGVKEPVEKYETTHGICKDCADKLKAKYKIIGPLYWDDIERLKNMVANGNPT